MDNICHTLVGAALGRAGLARTTRWGSAALMISANLPDLDVLVFATSTSPISFRRGWTHGIAAQLVLPLLLTGIVVLLGRRRARAGDTSPPVHAGWLLLLSYVGVYSHVFLDYLNNYGVRLLTPFDWRWFYGDAVFIIDPWLWLALGVGVWLSRRLERPAPARYAVAIAALYIAAMLVSARLARNVVVEWWTEMHGVPPQALMVGPLPLTPFTRDVVIDAGPHYERGTFSWRFGLVLDPAPIPKNDHAPEVAAARASPQVRSMLVWSRFPYWMVEPSEGGTQVTVIDARMMARGSFSATTFVPAAPSSSD